MKQGRQAWQYAVITRHDHKMTLGDPFMTNHESPTIIHIDPWPLAIMANWNQESSKDTKIGLFVDPVPYGHHLSGI